MSSSLEKQRSFEKNKRRLKVNQIIHKIDDLTYKQVQHSPLSAWVHFAYLTGIKAPSQKTVQLVKARLKRRSTRRYK